MSQLPETMTLWRKEALFADNDPDSERGSGHLGYCISIPHTHWCSWTGEDQSSGVKNQAEMSSSQSTDASERKGRPCRIEEE